MHSLLAALLLILPGDWGLPSSPTGRAGSAILDAIEQEETGATDSFIEDWCSDEFVNRVSGESILDVINEAHAILGSFTLTGAKKTDATSASLYLEGKNPDRPVRIAFEIQPDPPHLVTSLTIEAVQREQRFTTMNELTEYLLSEERSGHFSGAVLIATDEKILHRGAYGFASKRYGVRNEPATKFNIGSITKIFTDVAVFQLVEKGLIDPDKTIGKYLDDFPPHISDRVTVQHLLDHRSGMGHYWNERYISSVTKLRSVADYIELIREDSLMFEPGTQQRYSNSGYVVLGAIIEAVSGRDYYDYLQENVYRAAGMTDSGHFEMDSPVPNLAIGYTNQNPDGTTGSGFERSNLFFSMRGSPAGGSYSTLDDLYRFNTALRKGIFFAGPDSQARFGGGLGVAGGGPGTSAILESDWETGYAVVVLSNYDPPTGEDLGLAIMEMLQRNVETEVRDHQR